MSLQVPVVLIVGTRPEGIKMAPVYYALKKAGIPTILCSTMQHDELLREVFDVFAIKPDIELDVMRMGQDLFYLTQVILQKTKDVFSDIKPSLVIVQGDTTSSMAAALAAFYLEIPIIHIEAGLRTDDVQKPFPEEMNRRFIGVITTYHCAPTPTAVANLLAHGIRREHVFYTGNTIVDALRIINDKITRGIVSIRDEIIQRVQQCRDRNQKIVILTTHRRESFDGDIEHILETIKLFLQQHPDVFCFYAYHPNPKIIHALQAVDLANSANIYVCEPLLYKEMVYLLNAADLIVTDSGGIQEEAISLGKPVVVLREKTERMEGVLAGLAQVVGTDPIRILAGIKRGLERHNISYIEHIMHTYGDGYAAEKIVSIIKTYYEQAPIEDVLPVVENLNTTVKTIPMNIQATEKVCVLGLGYIGLPTAIIAADHKLAVVGIDIDAHRVQQINAGDPVIQEHTVYERLHGVLGSGYFRATTVIEPADYFIIAVPTPITEDKKADLQYVFDATNTIATVLKKGDTIIIESTISVGTTQHVADMLTEKTSLRAGEDFFVAHCPERVLPGNIVHELVANDRIIGGINRLSVEKAKQFYKYFVRGCLYLTSAQTAEMVKLIENSSRDVQLAFAHQVASMAYAAHLDPYEVIELANKHPRVNILRPTCGVGGHCIAIDPWFLVESFPEHTALIKTAREVNDAKSDEVYGFIVHAVEQWQEQHKRIGMVLLLGLTYKADVDDMRESPALRIARQCIRNTAMRTYVCEPHVKNVHLKPLVGDRLVSISDGLAQADIVVFLVGHQRFKALDRKLLHNKKILDFCGILYESKRPIVNNEALFWPAHSISHHSIMPHMDQPNDQREKSKSPTV